MSRIPFTADNELYCKLFITSEGSTAFLKREVGRENKEKDYLPGRPQFGLQDPNLGKDLEKELTTKDLNKLAPWLWLVAKQDHTHVAALTAQLVRGRQIIVTEDPELHLVWIHDRIFIKPIPRYLLSHGFWDFYLTSNTSPIPEALRTDIVKAACGFLRSYAFLIIHKSDHKIAVDLGLIPKGVRYPAFVRFISHFKSVENVSPRYEFGDLRLTRLNTWSKIVLRRFWFFRTTRQYGAYFARFYGPILFVFGVFSVVLSALQVALATPMGWQQIENVSRGVVIFTLISVVATAGILVALSIALILRESRLALKDLLRKKIAASRESKVKVGAV